MISSLNTNLFLAHPMEHEHDKVTESNFFLRVPWKMNTQPNFYQSKWKLKIHNENTKRQIHLEPPNGSCL